ncbi:hypothetical protein [Bradyrhizobium cosmicum]|uniref:hypothetical protein n=1 Tax=Bradyrhizobium cosmicum TaxID=1404864 RepID=UPI0028E2BF94|nr:hypothetical protein [Bradyrhizobium cosmicum]
MSFETKLIILALYGLAIVAWAIWWLQRYLKLSTELRRPGPGWPRRTDGSGRQTERAEVRLNILAILSNLAGLLIIALVGSLQIAVELWRPNADLPRLSPVVEELLRTRLPDQEVLRQQHKELVEAIKTDQSPKELNGALYAKVFDLQAQVEGLQAKLAELSPKPVAAVQTNPVMSSIASLANLAVLLPLAACLLAALGVLHFLYSSGAISGRVYTTAAATLAAGSLFGGFTFWKEFNVLKSLDSLIKVEYKPQQESRPGDLQSLGVRFDVSLRSDNLSPAEMDCGDRGISFASGDADLKSSAPIVRELIAKRLKGVGTSNRLAGIMLIGSADKRPLKPETAEKFSTNEGLARARVEAVRKLLEDELSRENLKVPVLGSFIGPSNAGSKASAGQLADDRVVQVCYLWNPTASVTSAGAQPLPRPSVDTAPPLPPAPAMLPIR